MASLHNSKTYQKGKIDMEKFKRLPKDNLRDLPIKERINYFKKLGTELIGKPLTHQQAKYMYEDSLRGEKYHNDIYIVDVYRGIDADKMVQNKDWLGKSTYIAIKRHDKEICNDWRDFQKIKNELVGEDIEALQIYPDEKRLMDTANQYWLFCLPKGQWIPFGFTERHVDYTERKGGFRKAGQRGVA
jgi:hypothetical protein